MTKIYTGYEAPSTAHENSGHPFLEIGGNQRLELIPAQTILPQSVILKVRCTPVYCTNEVIVSLSEYEAPPLSPYRSHPAVERIDLWLESNGHHCFGQGIRKSIDFDPQWDALLKAGSFYSMHFETLKQDVSFSDLDGFIPYGGSFNVDPGECAQIYFFAREEYSEIALTLRENTEESLKNAIESKEISILITYSGQSYQYSSVSYTLSQEKELFIEFIASF